MQQIKCVNQYGPCRTEYLFCAIPHLNTAQSSITAEDFKCLRLLINMEEAKLIEHKLISS